MVMMACVAPAVMVISLLASYALPCRACILAATAWRNAGMPGMGGYWLRPVVMACVTAPTKAGSHSKSGKPWPRLTAFFSVANADMTVKIVVPTAGSLLRRAGVRSSVLVDIVLMG